MFPNTPFHKSGRVFPFLVVLIPLIFWGLTWDTQPYLSSDDMGKDLYPFELALRGQWPCRDYFWQYGPMMLFYYPFWLAVGGIHLVSIRMGYAVLYLLCSILSYRTLRLLVSPPVAFLASLCYLIQGMYYPPYNFNHVGALPFLLASIFSLWKYYGEGKIRWCYFGMLALVGMALVKMTSGVFSFFAFLTSLVFFQGLSKRGHFLLLIMIFGATVFGAYLVQFLGSREIWVRECLTIAHRAVTEINPWVHLKHLVLWFLVWDRKRLWWLAIFLIFGVLGFLGLRKRDWKGEEKKIFRSAIISLLLFGVLNSIDYWLLGHIYRLDFWSFPVLVLLMGLSAEGASFLFGCKTRMLLGGLIFVGVLALPFQSVREAFAARVPERYLDFPRGKVYLVKETLSTVEAIKKGTHFILQNTDPHQKILAIPKDPLYCFLSGRWHVTRELDFEVENSTPEMEEVELVQELKTKPFPLLLLSNRDQSNPASDIGKIGHFGKTHCRKLGKYLFEHYQEIQTFGVWETKNPRQFHAIKIFKRKG